MATGPIETHLHRSFNWENGAPGPRMGPRGRSASCGNGLSAQCVRLRSEINRVLDELISNRSELGISYSQKDYDRIFPLFGPLLLGRTIALDNSARKTMFACCCDTFNSVDEFRTKSTSLNGRWSDIERALRSSDYNRYLLASLALAAQGVSGLSLSDAIHIWVNRNR